MAEEGYAYISRPKAWKEVLLLAARADCHKMKALLFQPYGLLAVARSTNGRGQNEDNLDEATRCVDCILSSICTKGAAPIDVVDHRCDLGYTPLHYAAASGNAAMLSLLDAVGSQALDVTSSDETCGMTPLHLAVSRGHTDCAALLIAMGVDSSLKTVAKSNSLCSQWHPYANKTALDIAKTFHCEDRDPEVLFLLCECDPSSTNMLRSCVKPSGGFANRNSTIAFLEGKAESTSNPFVAAWKVGKVPEWLQKQRDQLVVFARVKGAVRLALVHRDGEALEQHIDEGVQAGMPRSGVFIKDAYKHLNIINKAEENLRNAISSRKVVGLEEAIHDSQGEFCNMIILAEENALVLEAQKLLVRQNNLKPVVDECFAAIKSKDIETLERALERAQAFPLNVQHYEEERDLMEKTEKALQAAQFKKRMSEYYAKSDD